MKKIILLLFISLIATSCKNEKKATTDTVLNENTEAISEEKTSSLNIIPISHATMILEYNGIVIYVDPVGGSTAFEGQKSPDLILITDIHGDHFNEETIKALKASFVAPQAVIDKISDTVGVNYIVLNNGESESLEFGENTVSIEAIPMYNLREEALKFHEKGRGNGYVLTLGDERIYISGDTEDIPEMRNLKNIDKAFVCMNLPYTMPVESAADAVLEFKPKQVYPYHYRGTEGLSEVTKFKDIVNKGNPNIEVVQLDWYN